MGLIPAALQVRMGPTLLFRIFFPNYLKSQTQVFSSRVVAQDLDACHTLITQLDLVCYIVFLGFDCWKVYFLCM